MNNQDALVMSVLRLGFNPPATAYTKPDARGLEYGRWDVLILAADNIRVDYVAREDTLKSSYSMFFRFIGDFERWSRACT